MKTVIEVIKADLVTGDDGFVIYWPLKSAGGLTANDLRQIADEIDRRNKPWEEQLDKYMKENH